MCVRERERSRQESEKCGHFYFTTIFITATINSLWNSLMYLYLFHMYTLCARSVCLSMIHPLHTYTNAMVSVLTLRCTYASTNSCPALLHNCFWLAIKYGCLNWRFALCVWVCVRVYSISFRHFAIIAAYLYAYLLPSLPALLYRIINTRTQTTAHRMGMIIIIVVDVYSFSASM